MKILIVDDDIDILEQTEMYLKTKNNEFDIHTSDTAERALDMLEDINYDAIVSDYQMPEMDGLEFLEKIRKEKQKDTTFIIFTGKSREEVAIEALNLGADRYIQKGGQPKSQYGVLSKMIKQEVYHQRYKKRYRQLFNEINEGIAIHEIIHDDSGNPVDYRILDVNSNFESMLDLKSEDVIGKKATEVYGTEEPPYLDKYVKVVDTGEPEQFETYFSKMDKYFLISTFSPREGVFATAFHDITNRRKAEEALKESERKHRRLYETMTQGVVYQDSEGNIISANPAAERILGVSVEDMKDRTSDSPEWNAINEDGSQLPGDEHPSMKALRTGEQIKDFVMGVYNHEKEEYRWINIDAIPLFENEEEGPDKVYTIFKDITEQKKAEEEIVRSRSHLRAIIDNFPHSIIITDLEGKIIDCNRKNLDMLDIDTKEDLLGKSVFEFVTQEDKPKAREYLEQTLENGILNKIEHTIVDSNGNEFTAVVSGGVIEDDEGDPVSLMAVLEDVSGKER